LLLLQQQFSGFTANGSVGITTPVTWSTPRRDVTVTSSADKIDALNENVTNYRTNKAASDAGAIRRSSVGLARL